MTREEVNQLIENDFIPRLLELRGAGAAEYAGGENGFGNFERLAAELNISREAVLWVYAMKHKDGIASWINGHRSQRESVEGRIGDLIVYLLLLWAMVREDEAQRVGYEWPEAGIFGFSEDEIDELVSLFAQEGEPQVDWSFE